MSSAKKQITVGNVVEINDCAGKKTILVTNQEDHHSAPAYFRLTPAWLPVETKLFLASVSPMDKVYVVDDFYHGNLTICGDYVDVAFDAWNRDAVCRCQTQLISDGFDIYCPNPNCALTLASRIGRLAEASFFLSNQMQSDFMLGYFDNTGITEYNSKNYCCPFMAINHGVFWGHPGGSIESILLQNPNRPISLATFLVPSLFEEFLKTTKFTRTATTNIYRFYGEMDDFVNRRDPGDHRQNNLAKEFLKCLGIESLTDDVIEHIILSETSGTHLLADPMLVYIYTLTNFGELTNGLGLHRLEANAILSEVYKRKEELYDIFSYYCHNADDVQNCIGRFR